MKHFFSKWITIPVFIIFLTLFLFGALSETATANHSYFATGAGGMLQVVLFGFGGLRITDEGIVQENPLLPKQWKSLTIKGVGPKKETFVIE